MKWSHDIVSFSPLPFLYFFSHSLSFSLLLSPRQAFPRFYYVSDDSLLSILSSPHSTHSLQPHLGSLFAAVTNIIVSSPQDEETPVITAVESPEGEILQLELPVSVGILPPSAGHTLGFFVARSVRCACENESLWRSYSWKLYLVSFPYQSLLLEILLDLVPIPEATLGNCTWSRSHTRSWFQPTVHMHAPNCHGIESGNEASYIFYSQEYSDIQTKYTTNTVFHSIWEVLQL